MLARKSIRNVPEGLWKRLRVLAAARNTTISKLVVEALAAYINVRDIERYLKAEKE